MPIPSKHCQLFSLIINLLKVSKYLEKLDQTNIFDFISQQKMHRNECKQNQETSYMYHV